MRKLITVVAALGLLAVSAPAFGGSLGDFKESYREKDDDDDDDDDDEGWDDYDDPDCYDCTSAGALDDLSTTSIPTPAITSSPCA